MSALLNREDLHAKVRETAAYQIADDRFTLRYDIMPPWGMMTASLTDIPITDMREARRKLITALEDYMLKHALSVEHLQAIEPPRGYQPVNWGKLL